MEEKFAETKIERIRYFFEYETLIALNVTYEITFSNESKSEINTIKFDLGEYRPQLSIFDTNNEILEFAKADEAGLDNAENGKYSDYLIDIKLPENRVLKKNERRTLIIKYVSPSGDDDDTPQYANPPFSRFTFDLKEEINLYVVIKSSDNFEFVDYPYILDKEGNIIKGEIERLTQNKRFFQDESGQNSFFSIKGDTNDKTLEIIHRQGISHSIFNWIKAGRYLGIISGIVIFVFIFLMILLKINFSENNFLISYPIFVITSLVIIKGWLFSKDLDSILEQYDSEYLILISILFAELLFLLVQIFFSQNSIMPPVNISNCSDALNFTYGEIPMKGSISISNIYNSSISITT